MNDMLVRLLDLPDLSALEADLLTKNISVRRPIAPEKHLIEQWVKAHFSAYWASEVNVTLSQIPAHCFVAQKGNELIGFSCYETTGKNFFGPTGVIDAYRGLGLGKLLLIKSLEGLKNLGYTYAIIGGVGPVEYYQKTVGAVLIEGSEKSLYQNMLKSNTNKDV
jgi:predicted N-acetyltransferase YhbS